MAAITVATVQESSIAVNTSWFTAVATPTTKDITKYTLHVRVATSTVINAIIVDSAANSVIWDLNEGVALVAGSYYAFDVVLPPRYTLTFQHDTGTQNINAWVVQEDSSTEVT